MIIYHGSKDIIEKPIFGYGKKYNDYGLGFYCTESIELAKEWAVDENRDGYANRYEINDKKLNVLNLNSDCYCTLHWLGVLLENRSFELATPLAREAKKYLKNEFFVDLSKVDIVRGYRADDSYFSYAQDFINGAISYRQLTHAMKLGKLGEQVVLISKHAFDSVRFIDYEKALHIEWYNKKRERDSKARKEYFSIDKEKYVRGDIYIYQIIDEEMKSNDPRLQ